MTTPRLVSRCSYFITRSRGWRLFVIAGFLLLSSLWTHADSVTAYGANGNDTIDDTEAIRAAINSGNHITFPNGTYYISGNITVNASTAQDISAQNHQGATIKCTGANPAKIALYKFHYLGRFIFDNVSVEIIGNGTQTNARSVSYHKFINLPNSVGIRLVSWANYLVQNVTLKQNTVEGAYEGISGGCANSVFTGNVLRTCRTGIRLNQASSVTITGNNFYTCFVGIIFWADHQLGKPISNNIVELNNVYDATEEGISFDCIGNQSGSYTRWTNTVSYYEEPSGTATAVQLAAYPADPVAEFTNGYMVWLDDGQAIKGKACKITAVTWSATRNAFLCTIAGGPPAAQTNAGQRVVILSRLCDNNTVRNNYIARAGTAGITLWGAGYATSITGNRVENCSSGIHVRHLVGAGGTPGKHGPTFFNTVTGNTLINNELRFSDATYSTAYGTYKGKGNTHSGNTLTNSPVIWLNQE
jgi:hypothetical protein